MDCKLVFLSVFVLCMVGSGYCGYNVPPPPMGSSTGPYNPIPQHRSWIARPARSISPAEQAMLDYVEPIVETLRQKRFSVPIIVLPPPPPPSEDYTA